MTAMDIAKDIASALSVFVLSHSSREYLEEFDPKGFEQAVKALTALDPSFPERLKFAKEEVTKRREEARVAMGGAYITLDGTPLCKHSYLAIRGHRPHCYQEDVEKVMRDIEMLRSNNPEYKITFVLGMCPGDDS